MRQKLVDLPIYRVVARPPARRRRRDVHVKRLVIIIVILRVISFPTFQESDAEKSDQDLVVDVANEVIFA